MQNNYRRMGTCFSCEFVDCEDEVCEGERETCREYYCNLDNAYPLWTNKEDWNNDIIIWKSNHHVQLDAVCDDYQWDRT